MNYAAIAAALRGILEDVEARAIEHDEVGLCKLLWERLGELGAASATAPREEFVLGFCPLWPEYSGDPDYPVPSPFEECNASEAYFRNIGYGYHRWDPGHPYGQARIRMVKFLLQKAEEALAEQVW